MLKQKPNAAVGFGFDLAYLIRRAAEMGLLSLKAETVSFSPLQAGKFKKIPSTLFTTPLATPPTKLYLNTCKRKFYQINHRKVKKITAKHPFSLKGWHLPRFRKEKQDFFPNLYIIKMSNSTQPIIPRKIGNR